MPATILICRCHSAASSPVRKSGPAMAWPMAATCRTNAPKGGFTHGEAPAGLDSPFPGRRLNLLSELRMGVLHRRSLTDAPLG